MPHEGRELHPKDGDLYSPVTPEMQEFLEGLKGRYETWRTVAEVVGCRTRQLRKLRTGSHVTVSMSFWDRVLTTTGNEHLLEELLWFTAEDLLSLGLWSAPIVLNGRRRRKYGE